MNQAASGIARLVVIMLAALCPVAAHAQHIALTFDDGLDPREQPQAMAWNAAILQALSDAGVKSLLFAAGTRVDSPAGLSLVKEWGLAGHAVGNHTYSHKSFGERSTTLEAFTADIERNETLLSYMPGWTRRLRFPYLKEGDTAGKRDGMRNWLEAHHYSSGAVSIDASDWYYSARYVSWLAAHPATDPAAFRNAYLAHLWSRATYYDSLSRQLFGRSADHVILLHTNALNARFLPDVITMFQSKGWTIIDPAQAFQDPLYSMKPQMLPAGESILWSLAKQAGIQGLRYPAEDDIYEKSILDELGL